MSAKGVLAVLSIIGLVVAFIGAAIPQFLVTKKERGLRNYLTPAGMIAFAASILGLMTSIVSGLLQVSVRHDEELEARRVASDNKKLEQEREAAAKAIASEEKLWRKRSDDLTKRILENTDKQLSASETSINATLKGFELTQQRQERTILELERSTMRLLLPTGKLTYTVSLTIPCLGADSSDWCKLRTQARPGVRRLSDAADLSDSEGLDTNVTLYFAMPRIGERIKVGDGSGISGGLDMYGRLQSRLQERSPPDLFVTLREGSVGLGFVDSVPVIPPAISKDVSSLVDLQNRKLLVWGAPLEFATSLYFSVENANTTQLLSECARAKTDNGDFALDQESRRTAFVCTFKSIF